MKKLFKIKKGPSKRVHYEIAPSMHYDNRKVKFLTDAFASVFDTSQIFQKEVIGYEIHADHEGIQYSFNFPETYEDYLFQKLETAFKGSGVFPIYRDPSHTSDPYLHYDKDGSYLYSIVPTNHTFMPFDMSKEGQIYEELVNALGSLQEGERASVQILLRPIGDDWQNDYSEAYEHWLKGENLFRGVSSKAIAQSIVKGFVQGVQNVGKRILQEEEIVAQKRPFIPEVKTKLSQPGFQFQIKGIVQGSYKRQNQISRAVVFAFRNLAKDNDFLIKSSFKKKRDLQILTERTIPLWSPKHIVCVHEVANLIKLPDHTIEHPRINRTAPEERIVDETITKDGYYIAETVHARKPLPVHLSTRHPDDTNRTKLFVASPGAGKSTIIELLVYEAAKQGHGAAIFDIADGNLFERVMAMNPEFKDRIIAIDFTDLENPPAINFSALGGSEDERGLMFAEFFEVLFKTEDLARTQSFMMKAAMTVFADPNATILEFMQILRDKEFRQKFLPTIMSTQPDLYLWWMKEFPKISEGRWNENIAPILVRLDNFLYNTKMRNLLCQKGGRFTPRQWMDEGKIVLFNLSNGTFTEPEQRILMSLLNFMFWNATLSREDLTRKGKKPRPFHLIYDEPQTYMGATPMVSRAISKARKYGVSLSFFIQEAEQIIKQAPDLWKEILGMSPHMMVGPVSEATAKHVRQELNMSVEEILAIKKHQFHWILKTYANKESINPVVIKALPPRDSPLRKEDRIKDTSHVNSLKTKYTRYFSPLNKRQLQKDISARNMGMTVSEYEKAIQGYRQGQNEKASEGEVFF